MRWCARCQRRLYDQSAAFCPFDGTRLEVPASEESSADPYLGSTLGQFHLLAAIGSGSMGNVYRAWQAGMERTVAIKLLRADLLDDGELRRRFLREGRAAARLSHPNIVSVFMVGETDDGVPYLVMEHLSGETLDRVLDDGVRLPPARAAAIARQVASALAEAHAAGIVHRDLKPGNVVLLAQRGAGEQVKLFDFGIAKIADRLLVGGDVGRITRDGEIFGTPNYIAPEQAQGGALDGRADLYSLGILLYRMLAGKLPFEGNAVAVMLAHISREPPHLAEVAPDVDPALVDLVMRCLAKDPDRRFASAEAFIGALDRAVTAGPLGRARTPLATPQAVEAVGRVSAPLAAVSRDQADASETGLWASPRPSVAPERSPRARRGALRASLAGLGVVILCSGAGTGAAALFRDGGVAAAGEPGSGSAPARVDRPDAGEHSADQAALRSILVGDRGYAVRALLPEPVRAGAPVELLFDVWQPDGAPLDVPAIPVALNTLGSPGPGELASGPDTALAARPVPGLPGRYRLVERLPAGEAALLLELAGGSIHVHFEVAPAGDLTR
jgi:tRNA A-37 threonylcarbamoyl transferase component Bud32